MRRTDANSGSSGIVRLVVAPLVIAYWSGRGRFSDILGSCGRSDLVLQRGDCLFEVEYLPDGDAQVQQSDAANSAAHPTRSDDGLQPLDARLLRSIQQEEVVAPIAEAPHSLRPPRRDRE